MKPRSKSILEAVVREFTTTGEPVTSGSLYERYSFAIKPAMIRSELSELGAQGYVYQMHISSGRVPTDKGYRFFVHELLEKDLWDEDVRDEVLPCIQSLREEAWATFVRRFADHLGALSIGFLSEDAHLYSSGLQHLVSHLEREIETGFSDIVRDVELFSENLTRIGRALERVGKWPKVFIGKNPIIRSEHVSVTIDKFCIDGQDFLLFLVSPKRTDYERLFESVQALERSLVQS